MPEGPKGEIRLADAGAERHAGGAGAERDGTDSATADDGMLSSAAREAVLSGSPPPAGAGIADLLWRDDVGTAHLAVRALVRAHRDDLSRHTPVCSAHALGPESFDDPRVTLLSAWHGDALVACGALMRHDDALGELKTMRVVDAWRGCGIGDALLQRLIAFAREASCTRLALETGSAAPFTPALHFYARHGFTACAPFADYRDDPFSVHLSRAI